MTVKKVYLKSKTLIREMWTDQTLEFELASDWKMTSTIQPDPRDDKQTICTTAMETQPEEWVIDIFQGIVEKKYSGKSLFSTDDRYISPNMSDMPKSFQDYLNPITRQLWESERRLLDILQWRTNQKTPHQPYSSSGLSWSFDKEHWVTLPTNVTGIVLSSATKTILTTKIQQDVESIYASNLEIPLHYELYREAYSQWHDNPRSSLIVAVASVDYAFKWAARQLPIEKKIQSKIDNDKYSFPDIINNLIPLLSSLKSKDRQPQAFYSDEQVLEINKVRRDLVHGREGAIDSEFVWGAIAELKGVIKYLEYLVGLEWAIETRIIQR